MLLTPSGDRPKKKPKYFTNKSAGYIFLAENFKKFNNSEGKAGIDPFISEKCQIEDIYDKYSIFQNYSKETFPKRFRSLADQFRLNKFKERKRAESPSKFIFILFYCNLLVVCSHPTKLLLTKLIKRKGNSFPSKIQNSTEAKTVATTVCLTLCPSYLPPLPSPT